MADSVLTRNFEACVSSECRRCNDGPVTYFNNSADDQAFATPQIKAGTLLVASIELVEPTFRRTVVYVLEHSPGGTIGVVLNRSSDTPLSEIMPQWASATAQSQTLFIGGPVSRTSALCLGLLRPGADCSHSAALKTVSDRVAMIDLDVDPDIVLPYVERLRVYIGFAGWDAGQLEGELERKDWIPVTSEPQDILAAPEVDLWGRVLRRQPMPTRLLATHPIDVSVN